MKSVDKQVWRIVSRCGAGAGAGVAVVLALLVLAGCGESIPEVKGIEVPLNGGNFESEVLHDGGLVLVDFGASWCGWCRKMEPALAYLSVQYDERLKVGKIDTEESSEIAAEYAIDGLPTFVLFRDGEEVARRSGAMSYRALSAWVDEHLGG